MPFEEEKELEKEEERFNIPIGYRAWSMLFKEGEPRLGPLHRTDPWEPEIEMGRDPITGEEVPMRIVKSDWPGEEEAPWETSTHGLYMLKSPEELKKQFQGYPLHGTVYPFGKVREGPIGYRAQKAKVGAIGRWTISCYICGNPAKYYVHNLKAFPLCETHLKVIEKKLGEKGYTHEEVEHLIAKLARIYEADILEQEF